MRTSDASMHAAHPNLENVRLPPGLIQMPFGPPPGLAPQPLPSTSFDLQYDAWWVQPASLPMAPSSDELDALSETLSETLSDPVEVRSACSSGHSTAVANAVVDENAQDSEVWVLSPSIQPLKLAQSTEGEFCAFR